MTSPAPRLPEDPHLARLHRALEAELAWERQEHEALLRLSMADRVAAGVSWPSMRLAAPPLPGPGWTQLSLRAAARSATGGLHDGITPGDRVVVAPFSTPDQGFSGRCTLVEGDTAEIRSEVLEVPLPGWLEGGHVAVTRALDDTTTRRYQQALLAADRHASPLKEALLDPSPASAIATTRRASAGTGLGRLNAAQRRAGELALSAPALALIHGPPGTGKTALMVALLQALVADGERPLALADSNAAVDHLAVRAEAGGLDVLRLGSGWRVGASARHLTVEARLAEGPLAAPLRRLELDIRRAEGGEKRALVRELRKLQQQARAQILADSEVIACTLGTLAREAPGLPEVRTALIDEATQATEPAVWVAVPHVQRLILLGDPEQLGPVVKQPGNPLARSLLHRLVAAGVAAPMLEVQHRMSAALLSLVSEVYGPAYRPHPDVAAQRLVDLPGVGASPLTTASAVWVDTAGSGLGEARDPVSLSLYNEGEVEILVAAVAALRAAGVRAEDIGVIAPYSAQVARLRERLVGVEVDTVNAFQGREKEAILCSFVRSNADGELGFVADGRRLTVAVTRARRLLMCTGDSATLGNNARLAALMERIQALEPGAWQSVWEPPWDAALPAG